MDFICVNNDLITSRCDTSAFILSKSHKKVIKRLNKFLLDGISDKGDRSSSLHHEQQVSMDCSNSQMQSQYPKSGFDVNKVKNIVKQSMEVKARNGNNENLLNSTVVDTNPSRSDNQNSENQFSKKKSSESSSSRKSSVNGPDPTKPLRKKAKLMRMERKAEKLALTNRSSENVRKKSLKNVEKSLDALLNEVQSNGRHKLEVNFLL